MIGSFGNVISPVHLHVCESNSSPVNFFTALSTKTIISSEQESKYRRRLLVLLSALCKCVCVGGGGGGGRGGGK